MRQRNFILVLLIFVLVFLSFSFSSAHAQTPTGTETGTATSMATVIPESTPTLDPDLVIEPVRAFANDACVAMLLPVEDMSEGVATLSPTEEVNELAQVNNQKLEQGVKYPVLFIIHQGDAEILQLENGLQILLEGVTLDGVCNSLVQLEIEVEDQEALTEKNLIERADIKQALVWDLLDVEDLVWGLGESDVDEDTGRLDPDVAETLAEWMLYSTDEEEFTPDLIEAFEDIVRRASESGEMSEVVERALIHFVIEYVNLSLDTIVWYGYDAEADAFVLDVYGHDAPEALYQIAEFIEVEVENEDGEVEIQEEEILAYVGGWIVNTHRFQYLEQPREFFEGNEESLKWASALEFDEITAPYLLDESVQAAIQAEYYEDATGNAYWIESLQTEFGYEVQILRASFEDEELSIDAGGRFVFPLDLHNVSYTLGYMEADDLVIEVCADDWCVLGVVIFDSQEDTE